MNYARLKIHIIINGKTMIHAPVKYLYLKEKLQTGENPKSLTFEFPVIINFPKPLILDKGD